MDALIITLELILSSMPYFAVVFLLAFFGKWIFDKTTPFKIGAELTCQDNPAFGIAFAGYIVGLGIALSGALPGAAAEDLTGELLSILLYGVLTVILMRLSIYINDKAILHSFHINEEIVRDHNSGTGFVVAGSAVATGFMLRGVLSGHSDTVLLGIRDVVVYFIVGQVILVRSRRERRGARVGARVDDVAGRAPLGAPSEVRDAVLDPAVLGRCTHGAAWSSPSSCALLRWNPPRVRRERHALCS